MKNLLPVRLAPFLVLLLFAGCNRSVQATLPAPQVSEPVKMAPAEKTVEIRDAISDLEKPLSLDDRFSYTYGYMLFTTLQQQGFDNLSSTYFAKGALDAGKNTGFFSQEEMTQILHEVQTNLLQKAQQERAKIAAENLQAAESRIRDTDMASEIVEYTKNQILTQSGAAMLVQANTQSQNVLKLLS